MDLLKYGQRTVLCDLSEEWVLGIVSFVTEGLCSTSTELKSSFSVEPNKVMFIWHLLCFSRAVHSYAVSCTVLVCGPQPQCILFYPLKVYFCFAEAVHSYAVSCTVLVCGPQPQCILFYPLKVYFCFAEAVHSCSIAWTVFPVVICVVLSLLCPLRLSAEVINGHLEPMTSSRCDTKEQDWQDFHYFLSIVPEGEINYKIRTNSRDNSCVLYCVSLQESWTFFPVGETGLRLTSPVWYRTSVAISKPIACWN
jgi:hypothetical protein